MSEQRRAACLVIGGAGFLGRRLVVMLLAERPAQFSHVVVFDLNAFVDESDADDAGSAAVIHAARREGRLVTMCGDITNEADVARAVAGGANASLPAISVVFHLASVVYVGLNPCPALERVNVRGTECVIRACERAPHVSALVYTSTMDVAFDGRAHAGETEAEAGYAVDAAGRARGSPRLEYVRTKVEAERRVLAANGRARGGDAPPLRTVALRPSHLYGPGDPHALRQTLTALRSGGLPFRLGNPRGARFDVVYVDNVAQAHMVAAKRLVRDSSPAAVAAAAGRSGYGASTYTVAGEAFFIGEEHHVNYFSWAAPYAAAFGLAMPRFWLPFWLLMLVGWVVELAHAALRLVSGGHARWEPLFYSYHVRLLCQDYFFSNCKAHEVLGYHPAVSRDEAFRRTLAWLQRVFV